MKTAQLKKIIFEFQDENCKIYTLEMKEKEKCFSKFSADGLTLDELAYKFAQQLIKAGTA